MEKKVTITDEAGMHARPAAKLSKKAASFDNDITMTHKGKTVNLKSVMGVMSLGIGKDGEVTINVEGDEAESVMERIVSEMAELELIDKD